MPLKRLLLELPVACELSVSLNPRHRPCGFASLPLHRGAHTRQGTPRHEPLQQCHQILGALAGSVFRHQVGGRMRDPGICTHRPGGLSCRHLEYNSLACGIAKPRCTASRPCTAAPWQQLHLPDPPRWLELLPEAARAVSVPPALWVMVNTPGVPPAKPGEPWAPWTQGLGVCEGLLQSGT